MPLVVDQDLPGELVQAQERAEREFGRQEQRYERLVNGLSTYFVLAGGPWLGKLLPGVAGAQIAATYSGQTPPAPWVRGSSTPRASPPSAA